MYEEENYEAQLKKEGEMQNKRIIVVNHDDVYLQLVQDLLNDENYTNVSCLQTAGAYPVLLREQPAAEDAQPDDLGLPVGRGIGVGAPHRGVDERHEAEAQAGPVDGEVDVRRHGDHAPSLRDHRRRH